MIGIQNISKLNDVYGMNGAKNISSLLNTRFMFRQPDPDVAAWSAKNLGETEFEEVNESISYGANTMRDGVSINRTEKRKPVVTYSEIMNLNDLECYLRLAGNYPVSRIKILFKEREKISETFIARIIENDDLRAEVEAMIETLKKSEESKSDNDSKKEDSQNSVKIKGVKNKKIQKIRETEKLKRSKKLRESEKQKIIIDEQDHTYDP